MIQERSRWISITASVGTFMFLFLLTLRVDGQTPCVGAPAVQVQPPFDTTYTCTSLGSVPGVPTNYGGLTLLYNDTNTLLIGGAANVATGRIYQIGVVRDTSNHITGFTGTAAVYPSTGSTVGQNNDGGVVFGPGNVLFVTRYSQNQVEQTLPGSTAPDKVIGLTALGVTSSVGSINFVPPGFPGAGQLKLVSYSAGTWYSAAFAPDGFGTYDITSVTAGPNVGNGPEGIAFVPQGSATFPADSVLIVLYGAGTVITAPLDSNGDPIMASQQTFISGLSGAEGAFIDPLTGDFLFSTFGGGNQIVRISGFVPTAADVAVSGRVLTSSGRGIRGAIVTIVDPSGQTQAARTNTFGYFRFGAVAAGVSYVVRAKAKGYRFQPQLVNVNDQLTDLNITAKP